MKTQRVLNVILPKRPAVKGMRSVVLGVVFFLMAFGLSTVSLAGNVLGQDQQSAVAYFSNTDSSGCVTYVSVFANDLFLQFPPGPGASLSEATVLIFNEYCTQPIYAYGVTTLPDQDFQVSPNLDSATLNTTINVFDYISNTSFPVYVQTTWTSTGPLGRSNAHSHDSFGGCNNIFHRNYNVRPVQASATVSDGVTNFTPDGDTLAAELTSEQSGYVACE
jgi:hypothetical protein